MTTFPVSATHVHLLPTGQVMFFGEFDEGARAPRLWDPSTGQLKDLPLADYNLFCAGHSFLPDGRLLLSGGHVESHVGLPHSSVFNPFTLTWSRGPDMNDNRWYPTNTTLPNGDVVVLSGETHASGETNQLPQVWQSTTETWRDLTTATRDLPYYPRMFLAPNGKLFYAGPQRGSRWLDPEGTGTWYDGPRSEYNGRSYGSAVMYGSKVLIIGGGSPPTRTVEEIDLGQPSPTWVPRAPMAFARRQINATLLPDGKVLVTGGSGGSDFDDATQPIKVPELYDPQTNTWTQLASAGDYRGYHSTALLLPDGRILTAGGRNRRTAEVFTPPYLLQGGTRPAIQAVSSFLNPGTRFYLQTPDASRISQVTLLGLGSVTHAFDQNQRFLSLPFAQTDGGLSVTAPPSNLSAPPGYYMLFILDERGVPSVAQMVRLGIEPPRAQKKILLSDTWKYDDRGFDHGAAWLGLDFDDSGWKTGAGQLGYGDGDEGTVIEPGAPTVYFRKKITLDSPVTAATLEALFDDGIAVWINGVPVFARNVEKGTEFDAWATASVTNAYERVALSLESNPFVVGENVVTALVKQVSNTSPDLTFALSLEVEQVNAPSADKVLLTAPNGGEVFQPGAATTITWSSTGRLPGVDLSYSLNGGVSWLPIATGLPDTGVYPWTVPDVNSYQVLVRVSRFGSPFVSDVSNAVFTINRPSVELGIPFHSVWKYQDTGVDPGWRWLQPDFDDSGWASGMGQLGYGDGDEDTVLNRTYPSQPSVYFRRKFHVEGTVAEAHLRVLVDDGLALFVNGTLVFSRNVDKGLGHDKYASAAAENDRVEVALPTSVFIQGDNTIAVMVKQAGPTSPDLSFDLELQLGLVPHP